MAGGGDGRLHIERGGVNVAAEVELEGDLGAAERASRGHRVQPGNGRELFLERGRDGRSHRLGAGAGKAGGNLDSGEVNIRQIADG